MKLHRRKKAGLMKTAFAVCFMIVCCMVFSTIVVQAEENSYEYTQIAVKDAVADSVEPTGENGGLAEHAIDGSESTVWHTLWSGEGQKIMPHWISYSLNEPQLIGRIDYVGKPALNGVGNGVFKNIDIYVTTDVNTDPSGSTGWTHAANFSNISYTPSTGTETNRTASFTFEPVQASKVKIVVNESYTASSEEPENQYANALEIRTYSATAIETDNLPITMTIDKKEYTGSSIEDIVNKNNITINSVKNVVIDGGNLEYSDIQYLKNGSYFRFQNIENLTIDLTNAVMYGPDGNETTELPGGKLGSMQKLKSLRLIGITKIGYSNFYNIGRINGITLLEIPDVTHIENRAFQSAKFSFTELNLPKVEIIEDNAFEQARFNTIRLDSIQVLEDEVFKYSKVNSIVFPASLTYIGGKTLPIAEGGSATFQSENPPERNTISGWTPFVAVSTTNNITVYAPNNTYEASMFGPENKVTLIVPAYAEKYTVSGGNIDKTFAATATEEDILSAVETDAPESAISKMEILDDIPTGGKNNSVTVKITYTDNSSEEVTVTVNYGDASDVYSPEGKEIIVYVNDAVLPSDGVNNQNADGSAILPDGTTFAWTDNAPDTAAPIDKVSLSITVTYPDGTTDIILSTLTVKEIPVAKKYSVSYSFQSGTQNKELPDAVLKLLPETLNDLADGTEVTPSVLSKTEIKIDDGTWTFKGWDKDKEIINGSDVTFTGTWEFTAKADQKPTSSTPNTGDLASIGLWLSLSGIALGGTGGTVLFKRRKK